MAIEVGNIFEGRVTGVKPFGAFVALPEGRVGVQDVFGCSGPAWDLLKFYGLDAATICKTAHEMLGK